MINKKIMFSLTSLLLSATLFSGCASLGGGSKSSEKGSDTITLVWYPNESAETYKEARDAIGDVIAKATGKKVEQKTTTDYSIAIETITSGKGSIGFMGGQGYVEAHKKNEKVLPLVVNSGASGTLDDAIYYSWLSVKKGDEDQYKKDGKFSVDNIVGKKMSFVSNSSTSGFKVPTSFIIKHFSKEDKWKDLDADKLIEAGDGKFFKEVMFGQSHQGSAVNLLTGRAELAAFCDTSLAPYVKVESGTANEVGAVYKIKDGAEAPFDKLVGKEYVIVNSIPVLNGPFAVNTDVVSEEDRKKIIEALTSDETTNNSKIFYEKGGAGLIEKEDKNKFLEVEDAWYDPIRKLSE